MSVQEIRSELRQMIENETDISVLEAMRTILLKTGLNPLLKEKLTMRALKSEDDIKAGRIYDRNELIKKISA